MKKRACAALMALVMLLSLLPATAMAAGENTPEPQAEIEYEVTKDTYQTTLEEIQTEHTQGSKITLILTEDLGLSSSNSRSPITLGLENYSITYRSEEGAGPYSIGGKGASLQSAVGDVTFDNVWLTLNQGGSRGQGTVSTFYANGHKVEFTENFKQSIANLYGGASNNVVTSTHLIINGDLINGATGQNWRVYGGGLYTSGNSKNLVTGDVEIYLGPHSRTPWVYGGGENSGVGGNVTITMEGNASDPNHQIGNITGGGSVTKDGPTNGRYSGTVGGNVTLNLYSGKFAGLVSGGSYISTGGDQNQTPEDIQKLNDQNKRYDYLFFGTVAGNVNVVFGSDGAAEGSCYKSSQDNYNLAGSVYSVIQGDVNVTVNDGANLGMGLHGMGNNDIVEGSVNITMNGGTTDEIWGLGEAYYTSEGTHEIGRSDDPDNNYYYPKDALNITINGGKVGSVAWFERVEKGYGSTEYSDPQIYGNVMLEVNGGTITQIYMGDPGEAAPIAISSYKLPYVRGDKGIELHITGGTFKGCPSIFANSLNTVYMGQRIYFENSEIVYLYQIEGADATRNDEYNGGTADIIVNNTAPASIMYYKYQSGGEYVALEDCGSVDIQKGILALGGENTINGDFTISEDGILALAIKDTTYNWPNGVLNVDGEASIAAENTTGWLRTCEAGGTGKQLYAKGTEASEATPAVGDVYLRSNTTNETAEAESDAELLDLKNEDAVARGLYVEYTVQEDPCTAGSTKYSHAWRIAQGTPPARTVTVTFDKNHNDTSGYTEADPTTKTVTIESGETSGTVDALPTPPTREGYEFVGWNTDPDGKGTEFTANTEVTADTTVYAQWEKKADPTPPEEAEEVLWYYEVYYQSDEDPDEWVRWKHAQGGWAAPDAEVSISHEDFDGTDLGWGEVLGEDYVFDSTAPNRLSAKAGEATKDDPLKIYYKLAQQIAEDEIVVSPAPLTIYMGGTPYEGTVIDNTGTLVSSSDAGFPEPGFTVVLPEALEDVDVTDLLFEEKDGDRTWRFEPYDGNDDTEVYKLVPQGEDREPTWVQFTDPDTKQIVTSDDFNPGLHVNQTLKMSLYKGSGETAVGDIIVEHDDVIYEVDSSDTANLTVWGTTDQEQYAEVKNESGFTPTADLPGLTAPTGTTYTINDSEVQVKEGNVALLFDDILNHNGDDRKELLIQRAEEELTDTENTRSYEFKYLDLVDRNNGNVWVTASEDVTVYWPLPEGTDGETDFTLLHFEGLDRQMDSGDIADAIKDCTVDNSIPVTNTGTHVSFSVGSGGFSPFALVWETEDSTQPDPGPEPDPDPDPEPDPGPDPDPDPDPVDVTVVKQWVLDDGGQAAESVTVELWYNNFYREDTVELSAANNWTYTWENLDGDRNWSVRETNVPEGFTATVEHSGYTFTVINDDQAEVPDEPDDPDIPDEPDDPDIPDEPDDPDIPDEPDDPDIPDKPDDPDIPDEPDEPDVPDKPDEPELPQTGMMWWPVWLLTAIGALLVLYGLIQWARCRRKHES